MAVSNIINVEFGNITMVETAPCYQYDYGQKLKFTDLSLPSTYEVHFSNEAIQGITYTQLGDANGVSIPDSMFTSGKPIYAFIYLHKGDSDGKTAYVVKVPVRSRAKPSDYEPTPEQQSALTQAIAAIQEAAEIVSISQENKLKNIFTHWNGKTWYAYGTSITNIASEGKYPTYLAQMSGMTLVNKGISGGGIGDLGGYSKGQVYNAICNITDGKLNADLITLETGANDIATDVPLGTVYDTGQSTLAGCLNDCLQYLQANTNAQIAVIPSPVTTTQNPNSATKAYEWFKMIKEICDINRVHFINSNNNMGWSKLSSNKGSAYIVDHGHHTNLGGYIFAQNIWYQLRNIPTFNNEDIPTDTWTELFDGNLTVEAYQDYYRLSVIDNYTDTISVGNIYRVTFKGIQYVCEAVADENTGLIYIGNRRWSGGDTSSANEPFIAYVNNGQLRILSGETAGSTISFKIEKQTGEDIPTDTWTELFDGNLTVEAYQDYYRLSVIDNYTDTISVGNIYRVTFKGIQYVCEAVADENTGLIYIGNRRWSGGDTSSANEPFIAYVNNGQLRILSGETAGSTISFKIEKQTL